MAGSVNRVILIGNVGADPEVRRTQDGKAIVNIRLATSDQWRDKNTGERREKTEWHTVVIFSEGLAKVAEQYVKKGSKIYIEGSLQTRKWQDQGGNDRYSTEVVLTGFNSALTLLDSASDSSDRDSSGGDYASASSGERKRSPSQQAARTSHQAPYSPNDMNDDIPFAPEFR